MEGKMIGKIKVILSIISMILCAGCNAISPYVEDVKEFIISSTPSLTPTITVTPTPTPTPAPKIMSIEDTLTNCETLGKSKNLVIIEGKIYIPLYQIYGYEGWKGMKITRFVSTDSNYLTALIKVGQGPNTMDSLSEFFSERDLRIRDNDGQLIYDGYSVKLIGRMEYKEKSKNLRCTLRVEKIETKMPLEVNEPLEVKIAFLNKIYVPAGHRPDEQTTDCVELGGKKQLVLMRGSIVNTGSDITCDMGKCTVLVDDTTGRLDVTIPIGENPSSIAISEDVPGYDGWSIFDSNGNLADKRKITLIGVLNSSGFNCAMDVYWIE
jgi:hypothetical protein